MSIVPHAAALPQTASLVLLFVVTAGTLVSAILFVDRVRLALDRAEERLHLQAWQLRQLVPDAAKGAGDVGLPKGGSCPISDGLSWTPR